MIAVVGEFDEYTNDWLYLREGTIFPKYVPFQSFYILFLQLHIPNTGTLYSVTHRPRYRMRRGSFSSEGSVIVHPSNVRRVNISGSADAPAMLVPSLVHSVSVREAIQEVRMVQVYMSKVSILIPNLAHFYRVLIPSCKIVLTDLGGYDGVV